MQAENTRRIYYKTWSHLLFVLPVLVPIFFAVALVIFGFRSPSSSNKSTFFLGALGLIILWLFTPPARNLRRLFSPAFIIRRDGIVLPSGMFLSWTSIRDVVVFNHCGHKHFGLRLKEEIKTLDGKELDEVFKDDVNWSVFHMPFVMLLNSFRMPSDELLRVFHDEFGLPIQEKSKEVEIGQEGSLEKGASQ